MNSGKTPPYQRNIPYGKSEVYRKPARLAGTKSGQRKKGYNTLKSIIKMLTYYNFVFC
jgi:hypothetical protein